jgi:anti-sigma factor RsiW
MGQVKCGWARRRKWRYLDGTLPAPQKRQVEAHLQVCIPVPRWILRWRRTP